MPYPTYTISTDTADGKLNGTLLGEQIVGAALPAADNISRVGDILTITGTYTAPQKTTIDGLVAAHVGARNSEDILDSWSVVDSEKEVTSSGSWEHQGGITFNPEDYRSDMTNLILRATLGAKSAYVSGAKAQVTIRDMGTPTNLVTSPPQIDDTAGGWTSITFDTDVAIPGTRTTFCVCGDRGAATNLFARYARLALIEVTAM